MPLITCKEKSGISAHELSPNEALISLKLDGEITAWNYSATSIYGYTAQEAIGKNISVIIPGDILKDDLEMIMTFSKNPYCKTYQTARRRKNGETIAVNVFMTPIMDEKGKIHGISECSTDINTSFGSEEKQSILSAIVDSSDDAIISKTLDGIITSWNSAAQKMFGFSEQEALGKHISIIIPEDRLEEEDVIIDNVRHGDKIDHIETVRSTKEGKKLNISLTVSPIKNAQGEIIGASKVARDITDKRTAEEKQSLLAAIVNSSDDAIVSKTLEGIITSWNHSAEKMFGYTEKEAIGSHISLIIPTERIQEETVIIENIRNGRKIDHFETVRCRKDGGRVNVSLSVSPIKNWRGEVIGASKIARDITDKIEVEKKLQLYIEKLQELNIYKDEFMAMASHELKTPLTVIAVNLQILKLKMEQDPNITFINKSEEQVKKFNDLINNLLNVSKINAGQLDLEKTDFDLNHLIKEIISDLDQTTFHHNIIFTHDTTPFMVNGDRQKISQVVINVITNAIKYSPRGGNILLDIKKENDKVLVSCSDNGIGIPAKDLENIFARFYRVSGIASSFSGSGIGLYISSEVIKAHGGQIWAKSEPGNGSTFHFTLPSLPQADKPKELIQ